MHTRFLYITDKAKSPAEATMSAENWFNSFVPQDEAYDENGDFIDENANVAFFDWYVVGGRWNYALVFANLDDRRLVDLFENSSYNRNTDDRYKDNFSLFFPNADNPAETISAYQNIAMLITENIYNNLILELKDQFVDYYFESYEDININLIPKADLIGKAYAVVIDYHN